MVSDQSKQENETKVKKKNSYSSICKTSTNFTQTTTVNNNAPQQASNSNLIQQESNLIDMLRKYPYTCDRFEKLKQCEGNIPFFKWINNEQRWFKRCNAIHDSDDCLQGVYCLNKKDCQMVHPSEPIRKCRFSSDNNARWKDSVRNQKECHKKLLCGFIHTTAERLTWFDDKMYIRHMIDNLIAGYNQFKEGASDNSFNYYPIRYPSFTP